MQLEFVLGRDNAQSVRLRDNSSGQLALIDTSEITRVLLQVGELEIDSDVNPAMFDFVTANVGEGVILFKIGAMTGLFEGIFDSYITIFRAADPNGIRWTPHFSVKILE